MTDKCLFQEEPCRQEAQIGAIHETLKELKAVLIQIAEQGAFIKALQESDIRHDKAFENLFNRMGTLEVKVEGEKVKVGFMVAAIGIVSSGVSAFLIKLFK